MLSRFAQSNSFPSSIQQDILKDFKKLKNFKNVEWCNLSTVINILLSKTNINAAEK